MSLPNPQNQLSLFQPDILCPGLFGQQDGPAGRFEFFAANIMPTLWSLRPQLARMYDEQNGRRAYEPVILLAVTLLQFMERLPDRQAAEACTYDMRWKLALGLEMDAKGFHPTVMVKFRNRLLECGLEGVLEAMRQAGYLPRKSKQRLDSTHVVGLLSRMSRLECVRETVRKALERLEQQEGLVRPDRWSVWWERYVDSQPDWKASAEQLKNKLEQAGSDIRDILGWVKALAEDVEGFEEVGLLQRVYQENFEEIADGGIGVRRAQPAGAVHNPHEPQAQWSSKSTTAQKEWVGYKVQVAETVEEGPRQEGEPTRSVITAMVTQQATASDKSALPAVEAAWEKTGQERPETLYVDAGYTSGKELARAQAQGWRLEGPVQPPPQPDGRFGADAFEVSVEQRVARCPGGHLSSQCSRLEEADSGKVNYRFEWTGVCGDCALREKCVGRKQKHRSLLVGQYHSFVQARRREQCTEAFQRQMQFRNGVEGTVSELVRGHGLRRARYRGLAKVGLGNLFIGAAADCKRWWRRRVWEAKKLAKSVTVTEAWIEKAMATS